MPFIGNQPAKVPLTSADITDGIITSAKIADGTIVNADINASAAIVTSKLSGALGITEADQWRITTDLTGDQEPISSNLERNDSTGFSLLGTGMTQSSGIFSFPSTGYWYITAQFAYTASEADNQKTGNILITTDNSSYSNVATCVANFYAGSTLATASTSFLFDVTSTTNCKVKFETGTTGVSSQVTGSTTANRTFFTFIRLGDT